MAKMDRLSLAGSFLGACTFKTAIATHAGRIRVSTVSDINCGAMTIISILPQRPGSYDSPASRAIAAAKAVDVTQQG